MSFSEKILEKSDSYVFYKEGYEKLLQKDKENQETIKLKNREINGKKKFIEKKKLETQTKNDKIKDLRQQIAEEKEFISALQLEIEDYKNLIDSLEKKVSDIAQDLNKDLHDVNIAYVINSFPEHSQTFVINELKWLVENGYNVVVFFKREPEKAIDLNFEIISKQYESSAQLEKLLLDFDINLVHTHFVYPTCTKFTYPICDKLKIPFTVFAHAFDIFRQKSIEENNIDKISSSESCMGIFTLSKFHREFLIKHGAREDKIIITKQATDYKLCEVRKRDEIKKIIAISRFVEKKGINVMIDAAKFLENEDFEFEIYGFGELEEEYQQQINRLNSNNITIKGELQPPEVIEKLKDADLLISPCIIAENGDMDGFPTILFEAMAVGTPFIATDVSAIPEIIDDCENGFIVSAGDCKALAMKIMEISSMDFDELYQICIKAQSDVKNISSVEKTMNTYIQTVSQN